MLYRVKYDLKGKLNIHKYFSPEKPGHAVFQVERLGIRGVYPPAGGIVGPPINARDNIGAVN